MTHDSHHQDDAIAAQLSAWMDGELPEDQVRFLKRRLEHEPALRARWQRWQLASACMRGQAIEWVDVSAAVAAALAGEAPPESRRARHAPWLGWATAAVLVLSVALLPRWGSEQSGSEQTGHTVMAVVEPASALQVADSAEQPAAVQLPVNDAWGTTLASAAVSPVPVSGQPALPVPVPGKSKPWPRSPLIGREDAALEGYLVRHNGLLAEDGMEGLLPQVDVLAHDRVSRPLDEVDRP